MPFRRLFFISSLSVAMLYASPSRLLAAQPDAPSPASASLSGRTIEIEVADPFARQHAVGPLVQKSQEVLQDLQGSPPLADPWIIRIHVQGHLGNFEVSLSPATMEGDPRLVSCKCTYDELPGVVEPHVRALIAELEPMRESAETVSSPLLLPAQTTETTVTPEDPPPYLPPPSRGGFGALGGVGIGVLAVGMAGATLGIIRAAQGTDRTPGSLGDDIVHYQTPASIAVGVVGGVVMAAGITMIVIDQAVCKKRPKGCRSTRENSALFTGNGVVLRF